MVHTRDTRRRDRPNRDGNLWEIWRCCCAETKVKRKAGSANAWNEGKKKEEHDAWNASYKKRNRRIQETNGWYLESIGCVSMEASHLERISGPNPSIRRKENGTKRNRMERRTIPSSTCSFHVITNRFVCSSSSFAFSKNRYLWLYPTNVDWNEIRFVYNDFDSSRNVRRYVILVQRILETCVAFVSIHHPHLLFTSSFFEANVYVLFL